MQRRGVYRHAHGSDCKGNDAEADIVALGILVLRIGNLIGPHVVGAYSSEHIAYRHRERQNAGGAIAIRKNHDEDCRDPEAALVSQASDGVEEHVPADARGFSLTVLHPIAFFLPLDINAEMGRDAVIGREEGRQQVHLVEP